MTTVSITSMEAVVLTPKLHGWISDGMIILAALDPPGLSKTKYTSESSTESNLSFLLFILSIFSIEEPQNIGFLALNQLVKNIYLLG